MNKPSKDFNKFMIKEIKKNGDYVSKKREIGGIKFLQITHMQTKVLRSTVNEYCEYSDFLCDINGKKGKLSLTFRVFTNGDFEWQ